MKLLVGQVPYLPYHCRRPWCGSLDTKSTIERDFSINGERLVAVEHAMFKFEGLKVNSRDDRQTE